VTRSGAGFKPTSGSSGGGGEGAEPERDWYPTVDGTGLKPDDKDQRALVETGFERERKS